jgi:hypothetical protein
MEDAPANPRDPVLERLDLMKQEIDVLQITAAEKAKPWYRDLSTMMSVLALVFSFGTTYVSCRRTAAQDLLSTRQDLRSLLQRMAALPKENVEIAKKYADDPASQTLVSGFINQENTLLAKQAAELTRLLPPRTVSATEYYAVALALQNAYDLAGASEFFTRAVDAAGDFNTDIGVRRARANLFFLLGRPDEGREAYRQAADIFLKYPGFDSYTKTATSVQTELSWAYSEANAGFASAVAEHLKKAEDLIGGLQPSPGTTMLRAQVTQARTVFAGGQPASLPVGAPDLGLGLPRAK